MHAPPAPAPQLAPVDEEKMEDLIRIIIQTVTTDRILVFKRTYLQNMLMIHTYPIQSIYQFLPL